MASLVFQQAGPWGIVAIVVGAVVFGYLVPRPVLKETRKVAEIWREAYEHERAGRVAAEAQRDRLQFEYAETANRVLGALPVAASRSIGPGRTPDSGGDPDVAVAAKG